MIQRGVVQKFLFIKCYTAAVDRVQVEESTFMTGTDRILSKNNSHVSHQHKVI